jgi:uncharacterized cupredoxin-like copper-binding protein
MLIVRRLPTSCWSFAIGVAAVGLVIGCQYVEPGRSAPTPPAAYPSAPVVEIDASDFTFSAPDSLPAGPVTLHMTNHGQEPHHGQLLRLNDGVSLEEFMATLQRGDEQAATALVSIEGGPGLIDPHQASEVRLDLKPGTYLLACFVPGPDGVPHLAKGMLKPLRVVGTANPSSEPRVAATLTAKDFSFDVPAELPAGRATYKVTNLGPQPHEVGVIKLAPGATVEDVLAFYKDPGDQPPFQSIGGINGLGAGRSGFMTLDLQPGTYAAVCLIPDPASHVSHVHLGMIKRFTVKG